MKHLLLFVSVMLTVLASHAAPLKCKVECPDTVIAGEKFELVVTAENIPDFDDFSCNVYPDSNVVRVGMGRRDNNTIIWPFFARAESEKSTVVVTVESKSSSEVVFEQTVSFAVKAPETPIVEVSEITLSAMPVMAASEFFDGDGAAFIASFEPEGAWIEPMWTYLYFENLEIATDYFWDSTHFDDEYMPCPVYKYNVWIRKPCKTKAYIETTRLDGSVVRSNEVEIEVVASGADIPGPITSVSPVMNPDSTVLVEEGWIRDITFTVDPVVNSSLPANALPVVSIKDPNCLDASISKNEDGAFVLTLRGKEVTAASTAVRVNWLAGNDLITYINVDVVPAGSTGIDDIKAETGEDVIFDLSGRRLKNVGERGIYIINGRKTVVR